MPQDIDIKKVSTAYLKKRIRDMYQLKRDLYNNISNCKLAIKDADNIIDECEKELRGRGHL